VSYIKAQKDALIESTPSNQNEQFFLLQNNPLVYLHHPLAHDQLSLGTDSTQLARTAGVGFMATQCGMKKSALKDG